MKYIKPNVSFLRNNNNIEHVAKCAQICYASECAKDYNRFVNNLLKDGHVSMLRHGSVYMIINENYEGLQEQFLIEVLLNNPFCTTYHDLKANQLLVSTNIEFIRDVNEYYDMCKYIISDENVKQDKRFFDNDLIRYTFVIDTGIDIVEELNKVSPINIAEQSTICVDFDKKIDLCISKPHWFDFISKWKLYIAKFMFYIETCCYKIATNILKLKPEDARNFLPLKTNSKIVCTYSIKEWRRILDLKYYESKDKPHPDAYIVANQIKKILESLGVKF